MAAGSRAHGASAGVTAGASGGASYVGSSASCAVATTGGSTGAESDIVDESAFRPLGACTSRTIAFMSEGVTTRFVLQGLLIENVAKVRGEDHEGVEYYSDKLEIRVRIWLVSSFLIGPR